MQKISSSHLINSFLGYIYIYIYIYDLIWFDEGSSWNIFIKMLIVFSWIIIYICIAHFRDKHQSDLQVYFNTFGTKITYKVILSLLISMVKHSQSTQSNSFASLCNISKKKLGMEFIFCTKQPDMSNASKIGSW